MTKEIQPGVYFHLIPTQQFKTLRLYIRFSARHQAQSAAARTLLTSLLETNSRNYPTHTALSSALAELYGASFGVNMAKKGNLHQVNLSMNLVNGKYLGVSSLLDQATAFIKEILFAPNIVASSFDEGTFAIEKENLIAYMKSIAEDKQTYASQELQQLFFQSDADQSVPSYGTLASLTALTSQDLVATYEKMLNEDQVDVFLVGDVTEAEGGRFMAALPFSKTERVHPEIFYYPMADNVIAEKQEQEPLTQSKLNLGYAMDVYYGQPERFALMVFNGLFGGFPHSRLFMNVREKESMAYYASSSYDTFRGFVSVQTGIDGENRERVLHLIAQQLESLQRGEITAEELAQTKAMLKNSFLLSLDSPQAMIEAAYLDNWLPEAAMTDEMILAGIEAVTIKEVQKIAQKMQLKAVYCLEGVGKNA